MSLSLTLVYDLRFFSLFSARNPSIIIRPFDWISTYNTQKNNIDRPINQTTRHHRPNDQRGANRKIEKWKAAGEEDRVSLLKTILHSPCILFRQLLLAMFIFLVFFSVCFLYLCHSLFSLSIYLSVYLSLSLSVSVYLSLSLSVSLFHLSFSLLI